MPGRRPGPWWRQSKHRWYYTMESGEQKALPVTDPKDLGGAWAAVHAILSEIRGAVVPGVKAGTVSELAPGWLAERALRVQPDTLKKYREHLAWLARRFPGQPAGAVEAAKVAAAAAAEPWGDAHRNNHLTTAAAFLRWCGRVDRLPAPPKPARGPDAVIPEAVYAAVLHETRGDFRALVELLWLTGCRPGEATGLTVEAVQWDAGTATIKQHKTRHKTGRSRTLFLGSDALAVLARQRDRHGSGLLFRAARGRRFTLGGITKRFLRLSARVGHHLTSYCFRHTYITRALLAGVADAQVAALAGHTSTAMIHRVYSHVAADAKALREAAERATGKRAG